MIFSLMCEGHIICSLKTFTVIYFKIYLMTHIGYILRYAILKIFQDCT